MTGIRRRDMEFLKAETEAWTEQEIITEEQAGEILGLYEVKEYSLRKILLTAGGFLLMLALVSFIAAHWHELGKFFRVCVISAGYLGALCAYAFTGRSSTKTGRTFLILAGIIFGAGIYLITRMYNVKLSFSEVLGWWLVQIIATALITFDTWQVYFAQAVSLVYLGWINAIDIFALEFMGEARVPVSQFFLPVQGFAVLAVLWLATRRVKDRTAVNVNMLLTLLVLASRMSLCFGGTWTLIVLAVCGGALSFSRFSDAEFLGLLLAGLCGLVLTWAEVWRGGMAEYGSYLAVLSALLTACLMIANIWRGHSAAGITFCVLLVARYFFDHLFGYIPKAWGFGIAGLAFLIAGIYSGHRIKPEE
ncbi:MAG: DUF2157 domain-containing protein [Synergistaceae bacterium]|nr:DUF2157 domain-containing protein [Synergistaceae bacterium]